MPSKQCGIPRDWSKSEQLSVSEKISLRSGSASARYINSVSDLYAADEIDALLDEIRDLEPISVHTDDLQDFEIDGSISRLPYDSMTCDSRTSVHSWDSHALYTHANRMDDSEGRSIGGPVSMYCDTNHLKTPIGILRIVLLVTSVVCLGCLCSSGTAYYGLFSLPYVDRIRLMLFVILVTVLVTLLLLFLDISLLYHAFPFDYRRMAIGIYSMECAAFVGSSALIVHLTQIYQRSYPMIAKVTRDQLLATSIFGFLSGAIALGLTVYGIYEMVRLHFPKREDTDQLTLTERAAQHHHSSNRTKLLQTPVGGSEPPLTTTVWPIDDVQPCSSKHTHQSSPNNCKNSNVVVDVPDDQIGFRNSHRRNSNSRTYFNAAFVAYIVGLLTTMLVMHVYRHAQEPALLYLVPACIGAPLFLALIKGDIKALFQYEDHPAEEPGKGEDTKSDPTLEVKKKTK